MKLAYVVLPLALALAGAPAASWAGPADRKPSTDADASAREHFQRGQKLSAAGDYAAAYREFAAGYALTERPLFLFNMAEAARAGGDPAKARENYTLFLRADPKNALAATAQARLAEMDRAAAAAAAGPQLGPKPDPSTSPPAGGAAVTTPGREPVTPAPPAPTPMVSASSIPPHQLARSSEPETTPVWKKWPFWAVVGGVAAGSVIVYAVSRDNSACGDGCSQINFR